MCLMSAMHALKTNLSHATVDKILNYQYLWHSTRKTNMFHLQIFSQKEFSITCTNLPTLGLLLINQAMEIVSMQHYHCFLLIPESVKLSANLTLGSISIRYQFYINLEQYYFSVYSTMHMLLKRVRNQRLEN